MRIHRTLTLIILLAGFDGALAGAAPAVPESTRVVPTPDLWSFMEPAIIRFVCDVFTHSAGASCYRESNLSPQSAWTCTRATRIFTKILDCDNGLVFSSELLQILQKPETTRLLEDLAAKTKTHDASAPGVWEWLVNHSEIAGSEERALQLIGPLFQDKGSEVFAHLSIWPKAAGISQSTLTAYEQAANPEGFQLYPPLRLNMAHENILPQNAYHFYTIAHVAYRITKETGDPRHAFLVSYLMNRNYEFFSIRKREFDERLKAMPASDSSFWSSVQAFLHNEDQKSEQLNSLFESNQFGDSLHDIYLGYRGAMWGASLAAKTDFPVMNRAQFEKAFRRSPREFTNLAGRAFDHAPSHSK